MAMTPVVIGHTSCVAAIDFDKFSYPEGMKRNTRVNFDTYHDWIAFQSLRTSEMKNESFVSNRRFFSLSRKRFTDRYEYIEPSGAVLFAKQDVNERKALALWLLRNHFIYINFVSI